MHEEREMHEELSLDSGCCRRLADVNEDLSRSNRQQHQLPRADRVAQVVACIKPYQAFIACHQLKLARGDP